MLALLRNSFDLGERRRLAGFFGGVALLHVAGWGLLLVVAARQPTILALGGLAYTFGRRQAFEADHISAIDNTTRKLLQDRRRPVGVGFFFSLGHSTVVFLVSAALGLAVKWIVDGVVANGRIMGAADRGEKIPVGWGLDKAGKDPPVPKAVETLLPLCGAKGAGLSFMIECLTSLLLSQPRIAPDL